MADTEAEYCMRRAREEAWLALKSDKPEVAAAHHGMSVQYATRARHARTSSEPLRMIATQGR
ncbi:hypothetical protein [Flavisphingomonas formosensis]|uniref:hypothetical protein n=1 Tax=Flavisphingomonas formosensis TaxID=861534 RepID=UPI0012FC1548|nr:hypothetical protein [Sphingomonas formosensis]